MLNTRRLYLSSLLAHLLPETRGYSLKRKLYRWSGVKVGENVRICSSVKILGNASLSIGDNTWIGAGTIILKGTSIGSNCVIGAGSVIKGDVKSNSIVIQKRNSEIHCIDDPKKN